MVVLLMLMMEVNPLRVQTAHRKVRSFLRPKGLSHHWWSCSWCRTPPATTNASRRHQVRQLLQELSFRFRAVQAAQIQPDLALFDAADHWDRQLAQAP